MISELEAIYIDESGNTGQDLLNADQPVFVLATNNFSNEEIQALFAIFPVGEELHFKKLKNSEKGRKSLEDFINHPLITEKNILISISHKEYATVAQIVDQLIEPVLYDRGIDFYRFGQNVTFTNVIFWFGNFFWNKQAYRKALSSFVGMIRNKSKDDVDEFYNYIEQLYDSAEPENQEILKIIIDSKDQIDEILDSANKFTIDLTLPSFYLLCDLWYKKSKKRLLIRQDDSKQIEFFKEYIEFSRNLNLPIQDIGYGTRTMTFPSQIEKLELVNSEDHLGIQFSDLIASSINFMYSNKNSKQNAFVETIKNSKLLNLSNCHTIWPNTSITPKDLNMEEGTGQNILDFLANERIKKGI